LGGEPYIRRGSQKRGPDIVQMGLGGGKKTFWRESLKGKNLPGEGWEIHTKASGISIPNSRKIKIEMGVPPNGDNNLRTFHTDTLIPPENKGRGERGSWYRQEGLFRGKKP